MRVHAFIDGIGLNKELKYQFYFIKILYQILFEYDTEGIHFKIIKWQVKNVDLNELKRNLITWPGSTFVFQVQGDPFYENILPILETAF